MRSVGKHGKQASSGCGTSGGVRVRRVLAVSLCRTLRPVPAPRTSVWAHARGRRDSVWWEARAECSVWVPALVQNPQKHLVRDSVAAPSCSSVGFHWNREDAPCLP